MDEPEKGFLNKPMTRDQAVAFVKDCIWRYQVTNNGYWAWIAIRKQIEIGGRMPEVLLLYLYICASSIVNLGSGDPREMLQFMALADRRGGKRAASVAINEQSQMRIAKDYFDQIKLTPVKVEARRKVAARQKTTPGNVEQVVRKMEARMRSTIVPKHLQIAADMLVKARAKIV
ncbi:MAG: hypothetical protein EPN40_01915 [Rhodanobacteraceae bacterium]|nr:MAG: hypothetical protein EPN40_01915 [Rhodanobacteraceae bacterium]